MPAGTAMLISPDTVLTSPRPAEMEPIRTSPLALRALAEPSARRMFRSPLAEFTDTSSPARPISVSPDAVFTCTVAAASSSRTSPDAVVMLAEPVTWAAVTSPLAVRASREPISPVQRMSAEAVLSWHEEPAGRCTVRSSEVLLSSRRRSGTVTVRRPASNSTVVLAMSSSPRLPERDGVSDTVAVVTGPAITVMPPDGSVASRVIGSEAGNSQVVIVSVLRCSPGGMGVAGWVWGALPEHRVKLWQLHDVIMTSLGGICQAGVQSLCRQSSVNQRPECVIYCLSSADVPSRRARLRVQPIGTEDPHASGVRILRLDGGTAATAAGTGHPGHRASRAPGIPGHLGDQGHSGHPGAPRGSGHQ